MTRPQRQMMDPDMVEKAVHMLRRHSPEKVAAYLGFPIARIEEIKRRNPGERKRGRPLKREQAA